MQEALEKEKLVKDLLLQHPLIKEVRGRGLMLAAITASADVTNHVVLEAQKRGLILFWLLFEPKAIRITPPLTISKDELKKGCGIIIDILNTLL